eukprot:Gb_14740 [translate_table: standard]
MSAFKILASTRSALEGIQKSFLWSGAKDKRKIPLVAWDKVCTLKRVGGLGLRDLKTMNKALLGKLGWFVVKESSSIWVKILRAKYLRNLLDLMGVSPLPRGSEFWNSLVKCGDVLSLGFGWKIGGGQNVEFWDDCWLEDSPLNLSPFFSVLKANHLILEGSKVSSFILEGGGTWILLNLGVLSKMEEDAQVALNLKMRVLPTFASQDCLFWKATSSGDYSVKSAFSLLSKVTSLWDLAPRIWLKNLIPKIAIFS